MRPGVALARAVIHLVVEHRKKLRLGEPNAAAREVMHVRAGQLDVVRVRDVHAAGVRVGNPGHVATQLLQRQRVDLFRRK